MGGLNVINSSGNSKFFGNVTSGNVGIETSEPNETLHVQGTDPVFVTGGKITYSY